MPSPVVPVKLGKLPYKPDPRNLRLAKYLLTPKAVTSNWGRAVTVPWGMLGNDFAGDCAPVAKLHLDMVWSANAQRVTDVPTAAQALAAYSAISGYNPGAPVDPATGENPTDVGCVISDVLAYAKTTGIPVGTKIDDYIEVNPHDFAELSTAIDLFGGVDLGFQLPLAAQTMQNVWSGPPSVNRKPRKPKRFIEWFRNLFDPARDAWGDVGTSEPDLTGQWAPGSWGGHSVAGIAADAATKQVTVVSWGQLYTVDYSFLDAYCDEGWVIISPEWLKPDAIAPSGLDLAQLQTDLKTL